MERRCPNCGKCYLKVKRWVECPFCGALIHFKIKKTGRVRRVICHRNPKEEFKNYYHLNDNNFEEEE